jgi:hypothetical protein
LQNPSTHKEPVVKKLVKKAIEILLTSSLFGISALLDTRLFAQLAGQEETAARGIFIAIALIFAGCKVFLWLWGFIHKNKVAVLVAGVLSAMSIFASFASALAIMTTAATATETIIEDLDDLKGQIETLEGDIAALTKARDELPSDYITARTRYESLITPKRAELATLRASRTSARGTLSTQSSAASVYYLFEAVGRFFDPQGGKQLGDRIRFIFTLLVAGLIEVIAVVMSWFETRELKVDPALDSQHFVLIGGVTHISTGALTLCGKPTSEVIAEKGNRQLCPSCAVKSALLRLQSK